MEVSHHIMPRQNIGGAFLGWINNMEAKLPVDDMRYLDLERRIYRLEQSVLAFISLTTGEAKKVARDMKEYDALKDMLAQNLQAMATMEWPPKDDKKTKNSGSV